MKAINISYVSDDHDTDYINSGQLQLYEYIPVMLPAIYDDHLRNCSC